MSRDRVAALFALALVVMAAAVLATLAFRVDSNTEGVGTAKGTAKGASRESARNAVSISDLEALGRRISANTRGIKRKADRTEIRGVRTQRSLTTLNRVVLGSPGASGVAGRSIVGPRGITGLTTTGQQGAQGAQGVQGVGVDGTNGVDGKDSTVAGPPGRDGADGADGTDSTVPGPPPTDAQVQAVVAAYLQTHTAACDLTPDPSDSPTAMACTFP